MEPILRMDDVTAVYRHGAARLTALDHVSLRVGAGEFVVVMGATGSGKSTLLNCAAGLERTAAGSIHLLGHSITGMREHALSALRRRYVGMIFQSYNLLSELTVTQNVLLPCRLGARAARSVDDVLDAVGLTGTTRRPVGELSGGQRQRVAIARTLVTRPAIVFADEPTGALDPETGAHIMALLRRAVDEDGTTVVMVSHDPVVAAVSDRMVLLRDGRTVADGPTPDAATIRARLGVVGTMTGAVR